MSFLEDFNYGDLAFHSYEDFFEALLENISFNEEEHFSFHFELSNECSHDKRKRYCSQCGLGYCSHGRKKNQCSDCDPEASFQRTGRCSHGRQKYQCKAEASFQRTGYCSHGNVKSRCKSCGTGHCPHN